MIQISVIYDGKKQTLHLEDNAVLEDVIRQRQLNPETIITKKNGKLTHPAAPLADGDTIELVGIIYGG